MNYSDTNNKINKGKANLRLLIVLFGVSLGVFIFSFDTGMHLRSDQKELNPKLKSIEASASDVSLNKFVISESKPKLKTQHNFLFTCLMLESGFERKNRDVQAHTDLLTNINQIRQVVVRYIPGIL
jgi:hypothetical protein